MLTSVHSSSHGRSEFLAILRYQPGFQCSASDSESQKSLMTTCKLYLSSEFIYVDELVSRKNDVTGFEEKTM